jgi:hypothetical protein
MKAPLESVPLYILCLLAEIHLNRHVPAAGTETLKPINTEGRRLKKIERERERETLRE